MGRGKTWPEVRLEKELLPDGAWRPPECCEQSLGATDRTRTSNGVRTGVSLILCPQIGTSAWGHPASRNAETVWGATSAPAMPASISTATDTPVWVSRPWPLSRAAVLLLSRMPSRELPGPWLLLFRQKPCCLAGWQMCPEAGWHARHGPDTWAKAGPVS